MLSEGFYRKASTILDKIQQGKGTWKTLCLADDVKQKKLMYGLICELLKFRNSLEWICEASGIIKEEKKISKNIILILVWELLFFGALRCDASLKAMLLKYKTRLNAELVKLKVKRGIKDNKDLAEDFEHSIFPKFVRVNTLKGSVGEVCEYFEKVLKCQRLTSPITEEGFNPNLDQNTLSANDRRTSGKIIKFYLDPLVDNLLVFQPNATFYSNPLYTSGKIIIQDKPSCFPAIVLNPPTGAHVIDCCASPGNKTTHLAMLLGNEGGKIFAFERDAKRFNILEKMLKIAGCEKLVDSINADFLGVDPRDKKYSQVKYILVDPSCSGSGMKGRLDNLVDGEVSDMENAERLKALAAFQVSIMLHAMKFPNVQRLTYSTCSVHEAENEDVVRQVLEKCDGKFHLSTALPSWPRRGIDMAECVRVDPSTDRMNGFFVALFEKT